MLCHKGGPHKGLGCPLACTAEPPVTGMPWAGADSDGRDRDTSQRSDWVSGNRKPYNTTRCYF